MQMGRVAAIFLDCPDPREYFALAYLLAHRQRADTLTRKMTKQRKKRIAIFGLVPQNDHGTVIERRAIVGEHGHYGGEGRANIGSRIQEQVQSKVNCSAVLDRIVSFGE